MKWESMEFIFSFPVCFGFSLVAAHKQSKKKKKHSLIVININVIQMCVAL